ncbi:MAG: hypothetical protein QM479_00910 [Pseudomonadota bacterium]
MCSTPRASGTMKKVHHLPTSKTYFQSQSQIMRRASEIYDRKQEQRAKQQEKQAQENKHNNKVQETVETASLVKEAIRLVQETKAVEKTYVERFSQFINLIRSKIPPIVTN